jgi:ABC-type ATPase involved in cell division
LSLIGGFLHADEGSVKVFGHDVARLRASSTALLRRKIAFVPQELELIDDLSALANVRVALEVCGASRRRARRCATEALIAVDLGEFIDRPVRLLSTGQRRRVCLARGLVRDADIFVADEPSNDLDAERVLQLVRMVETMRESGRTIVMATNDPRLLTHSQQGGWRHLDLCGGQLMPGGVASLFRAATEDEASVLEADSGAGESPTNVLPFPIGAVAGGGE